MKVLILRRQSYGGLATFAESLRNALHVHGFVADSLDAAWIPNDTGKAVDRFVTDRLKEVGADYDLVHALGYRCAWACAEAYGEREVWLYSVSDLPKTTHPAMVDRMKMASLGMCASDAIKQRLEQEGVHKLKVVNPGTEIVDPPELSEEPIILAGGRLEKRNEFESLVQAMERVWLRIPNARLRIAGDGTELDNLQRLTFQLSRPDQIEFLGRLESLDDEFLTSMVVAVPGSQRGWSMLALEAMARGRSAIAINQGAMPEIIEDGVSGLLCDSAERLGDQLATALQSPMISSTLGGAARIRVAERFSIGTCAQQIADEYRNACQ